VDFASTCAQENIYDAIIRPKGLELKHVIEKCIVRSFIFLF
jgi:hypothetical protein